jgi:hypothetical protein
MNINASVIMSYTNDGMKRGQQSKPATDWSRRCNEAADPKGRKGPLPLPGDGPMDDVGGALTLPGVRRNWCVEAAR